MTASKRPRSRNAPSGRVTPKGTVPAGSKSRRRAQPAPAAENTDTSTDADEPADPEDHGNTDGHVIEHEPVSPHSFAERRSDQVHSRPGPSNPRRTGTRGGR